MGRPGAAGSTEAADGRQAARDFLATFGDPVPAANAAARAGATPAAPAGVGTPPRSGGSPSQGTALGDARSGMARPGVLRPGTRPGAARPGARPGLRSLTPPRPAVAAGARDSEAAVKRRLRPINRGGSLHGGALLAAARQSLVEEEEEKSNRLPAAGFSGAGGVEGTDSAGASRTNRSMTAGGPRESSGPSSGGAPVRSSSGRNLPRLHPSTGTMSGIANAKGGGRRWGLRASSLGRRRTTAPTTDGEAAPLVTEPGRQGGASLSGSVGAMIFAKKLKDKSMGEVRLLESQVQETTLVGMHVEYVVVTQYQVGEKKPKSATVSRSYRKFQAANKEIRKKFPTLPDLPEEATGAAEDNTVQARTIAIARFLSAAVMVPDVGADTAFLLFLGINDFGLNASRRDGAEANQHGIMSTFLGLKNTAIHHIPGAHGGQHGGRTLPKRIQRLIDAQQEDKAGAVFVEHADQVVGHGRDHSRNSDGVPVLDLWGVYKKRRRQEHINNICGLLVHLVYWVLLMLQLAKAPNRVGLLKHQNAIWDLVLDEEFPDVSFKKNFADIMTEEEMWQWVDGPLTNAFHPPGLANTTEPQPLLVNNDLIGALQIRQVRVIPQAQCSTSTEHLRVAGDWVGSGVVPHPSCDPTTHYQDCCAGRWLGANGDNEQYRPYGGVTGTAYTHTEGFSGINGPKVLRMANLPWDTHAEDYGSSGYSVLLDRDRTGWKQKLRELRCEGVPPPPPGGQACAPFIDKFTRLLVFSFNLLNGNDMTVPSTITLDTNDADQLLTAQIAFTVDATGHWDRFYKIYSMRPMRDYFWHGTDLVFVLWVTVLVVQFAADAFFVHKEGFSLYFKTGLGSFWHCLDLFIYALIGTAFYIGYVAHEESLEVMVDVERAMHSNEYIDVMGLRNHMRTMNKLMAWVSFFAIIKFLKFLHEIEQVSFMWRVVGSAKVDLVAFLTVMLILLGSFSVLTNQLFGSAERNFHSVTAAFLSLLQMMVGILNYDYDQMRETDQTMAPLFVVLFLFVMMLVSVNFFIAILSESYQKKKEQVKNNIDSKKKEKQKSHSHHEHAAMYDYNPTWQVQQLPSIMYKDLAKEMNVRSVLKVHPEGLNNGAKGICIHLFRETHRIKQSKTSDGTPEALEPGPYQRFDKFDKFEPENPLAEQGYNVLAQPDTESVVFLQLVHAGVSKHGQRILLELHSGEQLVLRDPGDFGSLIKCRVLHIFTRSKRQTFGGAQELKIDYYLNLQVIDVVSWESFKLDDFGNSILATKLGVEKEDNFSQVEDNILKEEIRRQDDPLALDNGSEQLPQTTTQLAETLGKSVEEVTARMEVLRFWLNQNTDPPKKLHLKLKMPLLLSLSLWWRSWFVNEDLHLVKNVWKSVENFFSYRRGIENDIEAFIDARINDLKGKCNMRDVADAKRVFQAANVPLHEFCWRMQLYLMMSGKSRRYLEDTYGSSKSAIVNHKWLEIYIEEEYIEQISLQISTADGEDDEDGAENEGGSKADAGSIAASADGSSDIGHDAKAEPFGPSMPALAEDGSDLGDVEQASHSSHSTFVEGGASPGWQRLRSSGLSLARDLDSGGGGGGGSAAAAGAAGAAAARTPPSSPMPRGRTPPSSPALSDGSNTNVAAPPRTESRWKSLREDDEPEPLRARPPSLSAESMESSFSRDGGGRGGGLNMSLSDTAGLENHLSHDQLALLSDAGMLGTTDQGGLLSPGAYRALSPAGMRGIPNELRSSSIVRSRRTVMLAKARNSAPAVRQRSMYT